MMFALPFRANRRIYDFSTDSFIGWRNHFIVVWQWVLD